MTERDDGSAAGSAAGWRRGAVAGLKSGVFATFVMSAFRIPVSMSPPPTSWFWAKYLGDGDPEAHVGPGLVLHLLYGTVGGGVFGALVGPRLDSTGASRERRSTLLGVVYGVVLSAFGVNVLLDRVLGLELESNERFVFHVSHVVYGLSLGAEFGANGSE